MEDVTKEINDLKFMVEELQKENESLKNKVKALESEKATTKSDCSNPQEMMTFTPTMPDKYADTSFLSYEERKEIKFEMTSNRLNCLRYNNLEPARFYNFGRKGEEDEKRPDEDDGMTSINLGLFRTPIAGRYRFDVDGRMDGVGKAEWYICCARKEDIYEDDDSDDYDSYDSDDENAESIKEKKKTEREEKVRNFKEKTRRHLLYTFDYDKDDHKMYFDGSVGMECEKGLVFWTEVVVLDGQFSQFSSGITFAGRLVC